MFARREKYVSSEDSSQTIAEPKPTPLPKARSQVLRVLAISILTLGVIDTVFGALLLGESNSNVAYSVGYLGFHIGVGVLIVALATTALITSIQSSGTILFTRAISPWIHRVLSGIIFGSALGAAIAGGFSFGIKGFSGASLAIEVFADIMLIGAILLTIFGSVFKPNPSA